MNLIVNSIKNHLSIRSPRAERLAELADKLDL